MLLYALIVGTAYIFYFMIAAAVYAAYFAVMGVCWLIMTAVDFVETRWFSQDEEQTAEHPR